MKSILLPFKIAEEQEITQQKQSGTFNKSCYAVKRRNANHS